MRIRLHGPLEEVAAVTLGQLVFQVTSVSEPYQDRKGTPRMWRVYLEGEIVANPIPATDTTGKPPTSATPPLSPPPASGPAVGKPKPLPSAIPLEVEGGEG